ncbi:hypothetical protein AAG906_032918 [Vitis piasezkii]
MPFELKNLGATYQRSMTKIFKPLIGRIVEVYINDFVVKEAFLLMRAYNMKLNPTKCAFGVNTGKFLGFMLPGRFITLFTDKLRSCLATNSSSHQPGRVVGTSREWSIQSLRFKGRPNFTVTNRGAARTSYSTRLSASNNEVEYEAILARLDLALTLAAVKLKICSDSQLVIEQIQKEYEAKDERMACYLELVQDNLAKLGEWAQCYRPSTLVTSLIATTSVCSIVETNIDGYTNWEIPSDRELAGMKSKAQDPSKFMLIVTDYVSKWVEAEAYVSIKDKDVSKFVWKNIASRFGIPQSIVADNGLQFDSIAFKTFCSKKRLEEAKGKTTHFALAYGMEAIIPTEIGMPITKIIVQGQMNENQDLEKHLDWADEVKGNANIWMTSYQQRAITHYNKKARPCVFRTKTLVLRRVFENMAEREVEKLRKTGKDPM